MMELRWLVGVDGNKALQYREKEGPKGEDWWGAWQDIPVVFDPDVEYQAKYAGRTD